MATTPVTNRLPSAHAGHVLFVTAETEPVAEQLAKVLNCRNIDCHRTGLAFAITLSEPFQRRELIFRLWAHLGESAHRKVHINSSHNTQCSATLEAYHQILNTEWFDDALENDWFTFYFQPIANVPSGSIVAHEALIRLELDRLYDGAAILSAAGLRGDLSEFDAYARRKAIASAGRHHHPGTLIFINIMPSSLRSPEACVEQALASIKGANLTAEEVVFEIVESEDHGNLESLKHACDLLRQAGLSLALDDVGSGHHKPPLIYEVRPQYVKLDRSVVNSLVNNGRATDFHRILEASTELGSIMIGEGVETEETATRLVERGVHWQQGYWIGRPVPERLLAPEDHVRLSLQRLADRLRKENNPRVRS